LIRDYVVADASVLLKWYLHDNEPSRHQAMLLYDRFVRGDLRIVLPEVAVYELGNRLVRVPKYGLALFSDTRELLTDIFPLDSGELKDLAARVAGLHSRGFKKVTVYDGAYLHIAALIDSPLITADALQARAARSLGIQVISLEDYR
jgi:predicted nucleic acid-binding protein